MNKARLPEYSISWPTETVDDDNVGIGNVLNAHTGELGLFSIAASTDHRRWPRGMDFAGNEEYGEGVLREMTRLRSTWRSPKTPVLIVLGVREANVLPSASATPTFPALSGRRAEAIEDLRNDWVDSPDEILSRLECSDTSFKDRTTAVFFAETMAFDETQKPRLLSALLQFADKNRFSTDDEVTTAVGSAIRKFAMNMPESSFEEYSDLLVPTDTATLSCDIELEVAKAVGWRLIKLENTKTGEYPNLETRLSELASDYLTPRLILQDNYASIVIHAAIAIGLLNGSRQDELIDRIAKLHKPWFSDLFARRLADATQKRRATVPGDVDNLTRLHERLIGATP